MSDMALLIIDMQKAMFMDENKQPYKGKEVLENIKFLLKAARENHVPVIFVQHTTQGKFRKDTSSWKLCPEISPDSDEPVILKTKPDAFFHTSLQEVLQQLKISKVIIVGMQTDFCVKHTCKGAFKHGYDVTLVSDAHTTFSNIFSNAESIVKKTNRTLSKKYVTLKPTSIIFA